MIAPAPPKILRVSQIVFLSQWEEKLGEPANCTVATV